MKREEMLEQLKVLKEDCFEMQMMDDTEKWKNSETALNIALDLLDEGYMDDLSYIKDLFNYGFIMIGIVMVMVLIIACQI